MPSTTCQQCDKEFYVKPNRLQRGWGKYCSNHCKHLGKKTGKLIACAFCQKLSYRSLEDQKRSKSGKFFCGKSCQAKWRNSLFSGKRHANWRGGESSYRNILKRADVDKICAKCGNSDVRLLAVHHKDKNRQNNELSNLIWLCHNCHYLVHHYSAEAKGFVVL